MKLLFCGFHNALNNLSLGDTNESTIIKVTHQGDSLLIMQSEQSPVGIQEGKPKLNIQLDSIYSKVSTWNANVY